MKKRFTFHQQYKHSGTFANRKCKDLFYPKIRKCVTRFIQSSHENATPYSGTSQGTTLPPGEGGLFAVRRVMLSFVA